MIPQNVPYYQSKCSTCRPSAVTQAHSRPRCSSFASSMTCSCRPDHAAVRCRFSDVFSEPQCTLTNLATTGHALCTHAAPKQFQLFVIIIQFTRYCIKNWKPQVPAWKINFFIWRLVFVFARLCAIFFSSKFCLWQSENATNLVFCSCECQARPTDCLSHLMHLPGTHWSAADESGLKWSATKIYLITQHRTVWLQVGPLFCRMSQSRRRLPGNIAHVAFYRL